MEFSIFGIQEKDADSIPIKKNSTYKTAFLSLVPVRGTSSWSSVEYSIPILSALCLEFTDWSGSCKSGSDKAEDQSARPKDLS